LAPGLVQLWFPRCQRCHQSTTRAKVRWTNDKNPATATCAVGRHAARALVE
jgi:hypothetical protein